MAALGRRHLRFLHARDAAVFEAMHDVLGKLDLAHASAAIDEGRLTDAVAGTPVKWHTPPMILPISDRMVRRVDRAEDHEHYVAARSRLSYELSDEF